MAVGLDPGELEPDSTRPVWLVTELSPYIESTSLFRVDIRRPQILVSFFSYIFRFSPSSP